MAFLPNYMGTTDAQQIVWLRVFSDALNAAPATYQLDTVEAVAINALVTVAEAAFAIGGTTGRFANDVATYTPVTAAAFAVDIAAAKAMAAAMAMLIRQNPGITDPEKIAAGVRPVNANRIPIPTPVTLPLLSILFAAPGTHTLEFADSATPALKAKPFGSVGMLLFVHVAAAAVMDPLLASYLLTAPKNPVFASFAIGDNGMIATYFARWITKKGLMGPFSAPVAMTIAF